MAASIDQARLDVESAFAQARAWADTAEPRSFAEMEGKLWTLVLALGRALVALFLARQVQRPRALEYEHDGRTYELAETRTTEFGCLFGKVSFSRRVGRQRGWFRRLCADLPLDRELGLCVGFSLGAVLAMTRLCAQMAFCSARETFRQSHQWAPSPRAVLRMVDAVGEHARPFLEQAVAPDDDGEILVIQADGRGAPMIGQAEYDRRRGRRSNPSANRRLERRRRRTGRARPRRAKGKKSKNAKVAIVGVIYTLRKTPHGLQGPINKRMIATFEGHEALFVWLRREADKRGYGRKRTLFLGDGSDHIWRNQKRYFDAAEVCLDWYHVVEKLWTAGECIHGEGSAELAAWIAEQTRKLRRGALAQLFTELSEAYARIPKTGPGNKGKRARLLNIMEYLGEHRHRMRYDRLRRDDLDIGTGAVEGAVRNLVAMRLDGPGMRWGRERSEAVLRLRCILLNGQWTDFERYLSLRSLTLRPQPKPARTYDALPRGLKEAA